MRYLVLLALLGAACADKKPPAAAPAPAASGKVETPEYVVALSDAQLRGGAITITAKSPLHINPDYPTAFKPDPGEVKFEGERVALAAQTKKPCAQGDDTCEVRATLPWTGAAGQQVSGTVLFSVCEPEKCLIEKVRVATTLP
jgi:hypothetical protein